MIYTEQIFSLVLSLCNLLLLVLIVVRVFHGVNSLLIILLTVLLCISQLLLLHHVGCLSLIQLLRVLLLTIVCLL